MCGIAGIVTWQYRTRQDLGEIVTEMGNQLRHRGPDDSGVWIDATHGVAFAHRRLAIVDLSEAGHQPMTSASGRFVICFNGEIYNHQKLRRELSSRGAQFRGSSDTEVLLAACEWWGIEETLRRSVGMFAFALWDSWERVLFLARDRMGEKPLYIAHLPWGIAFASELRAFEALPGWQYDVEPGALASLLKSGYVTEHLCIDRKVTRLPAAAFAAIGRSDIAAGSRRVSESIRAARRYWNLEQDVAATAVPDDATAAVDHLETLLRESLEGQRMADVPLGAFLSGGVDSSVVTGVLQSISSQPVRTFSIGFEDAEYDESSFARAVAEHLKCVHTEFRVSAAEALRVVGRLADVYDEPLADPSQVPTILVARLARQAVTVCLSGDGGDELFGGYNRYFWSGRWGKRFDWLPKVVREVLGGTAALTLRAAPDGMVRRIVSGDVGAGGAPLQNPRGKLEKAIAMLREDDPVRRYSQLTRVIDPGELLTSTVDHGSTDQLRAQMERWGEVFGAMMTDIADYLPGDQLARVDRASMSVSLEMRAPLLDHRVAAFAFAATRKFGEAQVASHPKWLLREVLYRHVPRTLVDRPKMGFSIPLDRWLRVDLRDWAESLLDARSLQTHGLLRADAVGKLWREHLSGRADNSRPLWSLLMFQQWFEEARRRSSRTVHH